MVDVRRGEEVPEDEASVSGVAVMPSNAVANTIVPLEPAVIGKTVA